MHHLKVDNGTLTDRVEIANTFDAAIEKSSSSNSYSKEFQSIKAQKEKQKINVKTIKNVRYNKKFTMRDSKRSLKSPAIHLQAQIRSSLKFYATFQLRLFIYYWTRWSFCKRWFMKSTTYTFWTAIYRCFYEDSAICLIFVTGTVG